MSDVLDLRRLRVVLEIVRTGSFSAAAHSLSFSPSAVSQQGTELVAHAERLLAQAAEAEADLSAIARAQAGQLRLGSFPTATTAFAARAARVFRERHTRVELAVIDGEPFESVAALGAGLLDLALVFSFENWPAGKTYEGSLVEANAELEEHPLFDDPFMLLLPVDHDLAGHDVVEFEQLAGRRVSARAPWSLDFEVLCRRAGFEPLLDNSHQSSDFAAYQGYLAAGGGLTLIPRMAVDVLRSGLTTRPVVPSLNRRVSILSRVPRPLATSAIAALIDIVRAEAALTVL